MSDAIFKIDRLEYLVTYYCLLYLYLSTYLIHLIKKVTPEYEKQITVCTSQR